MLCYSIINKRWKTVSTITQTFDIYGELQDRRGDSIEHDLVVRPSQLIHRLNWLDCSYYNLKLIVRGWVQRECVTLTNLELST